MNRLSGSGQQPALATGAGNTMKLNPQFDNSAANPESAGNGLHSPWPLARWLLGAAILITAALYAGRFGGYWLGDDFTNLHTYSGWAEQGRLWSETWLRFGQGISAEGSAFRPLSILSLSANYALAGSWYPGWFAINLLVHLANGVLIWLLLGRLGQVCGNTRGVGAALAAALFLLCPVLAEGVYWISARADVWVTLLTLSALLLWLDGRRRCIALVPLLLTLGLAFKESAAVFPLQLSLLALAWPQSRGRNRLWALAACWLLLALFLAWRAYLFGSAWQVYATPHSGAAGPTLETLTAALASLAPWWSALFASTPSSAVVYAVSIGAGTLIALTSLRAAALRFSLALLVAALMMALATLLNLGTLSAHGEGGRLVYTPMAWLALALGLALSPSTQTTVRSARRIAAAWLSVALLSGSYALQQQLLQVRAAQNQLRAMVQAIPTWAAEHPGLTMLLVAEHYRHVVTTRNAQGALASPPLQTDSLLGQVLPTLPSDMDVQHSKLARGMVTHFQRLRPRLIDADVTAHMAIQVAPIWPERYACWSTREYRIIDLPYADPSDPQRWRAELAEGFRRCACPDPAQADCR